MENSITNWKPAADVWIAFAKAHPELGYVPTINSWIHFQRRYVNHLIGLDVVRRSPVRSAMIADTKRFERVVFDLLTRPDAVTSAAESIP